MTGTHVISYLTEAIHSIMTVGYDWALIARALASMAVLWVGSLTSSSPCRDAVDRTAIGCETRLPVRGMIRPDWARCIRASCR
jgi:hypothetical protein